MIHCSDATFTNWIARSIQRYSRKKFSKALSRAGTGNANNVHFWHRNIDN